MLVSNVILETEQKACSISLNLSELRVLSSENISEHWCPEERSLANVVWDISLTQYFPRSPKEELGTQGTTLSVPVLEI